MHEVFTHLLPAIALLIIGAALFSIDVQIPAGAVSVPAATETLIVAGRQVALPSTTGKTVVVISCLVVTDGTGNQGVHARVYRGADATGTLIGQGTFTYSGTELSVPINLTVTEPINNAAYEQYCFTLQCPAATGAQSATLASIQTMMLSG